MTFTAPNVFQRFAIPFLASIGLALAAHAEEPDLYEVGDKFAAFSTSDQHEKTVRVSPATGTKYLIISFTMGNGKDANRFFAEKGATYLEEHQAKFLANIYGMPGVGRLFALPKMKKYPHRILLGDDEHLLDRIPTQKGKLTVIEFDQDNLISRIRFMDPKRDLGGLFE
ncbi:MAG: hypothetical protein ACKVI3_09335 [Verrucomicrobiia bacterium]|tara:strand:- start:8135 stop:8641 length:507 start_codon:yes stop_codon:yes gene_type:complete